MLAADLSAVSRPSDSERLDRVRSLCAAHGMNLVGAVTAEEYDASQPCGRRATERMPNCGTILLLGSGGRAAWDAIRADEGGEIHPPRRGYDPIDRWSERVAREVVKWLGGQGVRGRLHRADARPFLNFRQLAEMAGLGVISPVIGHLLHPEFGPWVSLRIAVLLEGRPFGDRPGQPLHDFYPCCTCHKPCVSACPSEAYDGAGRVDVLACADWRVKGGCATGCQTLGACPVGAQHRYGAAEESFRHRYSLFAIQKWQGVGFWRLVPRVLRGRF